MVDSITQMHNRDSLLRDLEGLRNAQADLHRAKQALGYEREAIANFTAYALSHEYGDIDSPAAIEVLIVGLHELKRRLAKNSGLRKSKS